MLSNQQTERWAYILDKFGLGQKKKKAVKVVKCVKEKRGSQIKIRLKAQSEQAKTERARLITENGKNSLDCFADLPMVGLNFYPSHIFFSFVKMNLIAAGRVWCQFFRT